MDEIKIDVVLDNWCSEWRVADREEFRSALFEAVHDMEAQLQEMTIDRNGWGDMCQELKAQLAEKEAQICGARERNQALEDLLVCYRIGKHPTEKLLDTLERTRGASLPVCGHAEEVKKWKSEVEFVNNWLMTNGPKVSNIKEKMTAIEELVATLRAELDLERGRVMEWEFGAQHKIREDGLSCFACGTYRKPSDPRHDWTRDDWTAARKGISK